MLKGIHNTKVHKDCPFDIETLDEFRNDLLNVATANGCPVHPSWAAGHQRHYARQIKRHTDRLQRLKRLHAMALGLYMCFRLNGQDGQVQKQRMERLAKEIQRLDPTIESVKSVKSVFKKK